MTFGTTMNKRHKDGSGGGGVLELKTTTRYEQNDDTSHHGHGGPSPTSVMFEEGDLSNNSFTNNGTIKKKLFSSSSNSKKSTTSKLPNQYNSHCPVVEICHMHKVLKPNGSILGREVAQVVLPNFATLEETIPLIPNTIGQSNNNNKNDLEYTLVEENETNNIVDRSNTSKSVVLSRATICSIDGRRGITSRRIHEFMTRTFHPMLQRLGYGRGDRISLVLPNGSELALAILATVNYASCVPLNAFGAHSELLADLKACGASLVVGLVAPEYAHVSALAKRLDIPFLGIIPSSDEAGIFEFDVSEEYITQVAAQQEEKRERQRQQRNEQQQQGRNAANNHNNDVSSLLSSPSDRSSSPTRFSYYTPMARDNEADCGAGGTSSSTPSNAAPTTSSYNNDFASIVPPRTKASNTNNNTNDMDDDKFQPNQHPDEVLVLFTSGTTGSKKLVPHLLGDILVAAATIAVSWDLCPDDVNCNLMPLFHVGGIIRQVFSPLISGGCVICCPSFDPSTFWTLLAERKFNWYYAAPTMHQLILQHYQLLKDEDELVGDALMNPKLRMIANAAGGLAPSLAYQLRDHFSNGGTACHVLPSYGMTECMPISSPPHNYTLQKPGTSGVPVGPEVAILNLETNTPLPAMSEGPICVRGFPCFRGYAPTHQDKGGQDKSSLNESTFLQPGNWFNTGDLGYLDSDGYLFITGRAKEVINRGGEIISPLEVEEALMKHPSIKQALCFSCPHSVLQEVVGVVVVSMEDRPRIDLSSLHTYLAEHRLLTAPKWPQVLVFMNALPKSHTNKLLRVNLAQRLELPSVKNDSANTQTSRIYEATCPPQGTSTKLPIPSWNVVMDAKHVEQQLLQVIQTRDKYPKLCVTTLKQSDKTPQLVLYCSFPLDRLEVLDTAQQTLHRYLVPHYFVSVEESVMTHYWNLIKSGKKVPDDLLPMPNIRRDGLQAMMRRRESQLYHQAEQTTKSVESGIMLCGSPVSTSGTNKMKKTTTVKHNASFAVVATTTTSTPTRTTPTLTTNLPDPLIVEHLQQLFVDILDLDCPPAPTSNFFNLGGSSMLASKLASKIRKHYKGLQTLSGSQIFHYSTCLELAAYIEERRISTEGTRRSTLHTTAPVVNITTPKPSNLTPLPPNLIRQARSATGNDNTSTTIGGGRNNKDSSSDEEQDRDDDEKETNGNGGGQRNGKESNYGDNGLNRGGPSAFLEHDDDADHPQTTFVESKPQLEPIPWTFWTYLIQALPLGIVFPMYTLGRYVLFMTVLFVVSSILDDRFDSDQSSWFMSLVPIMTSFVVFQMIVGILSPLLFVCIKWIIIGTYKEGHYPTFGSFYLRWWFVDVCRKMMGRGIFGWSDVTLKWYLQMLGATIGDNVRIDRSADLAEFDLLVIENGVAIEKSTIRPFGLSEHSTFVLKPIVLGKHSSVGYKATVIRGTCLGDDVHLGPQMSTYDLYPSMLPHTNDESRRTQMPLKELQSSTKLHATYNQQLMPQPNWIYSTLADSIIFMVTWISHIPTLILFYYMIHLPGRPNRGDIISQVLYEEQYADMSLPLAILGWLCDVKRIPYYILIRCSKAMVEPLLYMMCAILVKRTIIGKFVEGPRLQDNQWELLRVYLSQTMISRDRIQLVQDLVGRHFYLVTWMYRALGATVGDRIFWPGTMFATDGLWDLLEIGDDVVFGSRSALICSTTTHFHKIKLCAGSNVSDNAVVLPGSTLQRNAVLGAYGICPFQTTLSEGSLWFGCDFNGQPICLESGASSAGSKFQNPLNDVENGTRQSMANNNSTNGRDLDLVGDDTTLRPFGRAFYKGQTTYWMPPLMCIVAFTYMTQFSHVILHCMPLITSFHLTAYLMFGTNYLNIMQHKLQDIVSDEDEHQDAYYMYNNGDEEEANAYEEAEEYEAANAWSSSSNGKIMMILLGCYILTHLLRVVIWLLTEWTSKAMFIGQRQEGKYSWDTSSYPIRWVFHQLIQKQRQLYGMSILNYITGSPYLHALFRSLGMTIGTQGCLWPTGGDPYPPELDLISVGNHCNIDNGKLVCHLNTRGTFELTSIEIQDNVTIKRDAKVQKGCICESGLVLLEHSLCMTGEILEQDTIWQGAPAITVGETTSTLATTDIANAHDKKINDDNDNYDDNANVYGAFV